MPNRILRDGILSSEAMASLSWAAEVFYRRLMSVVDDHGRFHGLPKLIRAACYPLQIDKVSDADIGKWLTECVTAALVSVYPAVDGKRYIQIEKFGQQVRSKSKFPEPIEGDLDQLKSFASNCEQTQSNAHLDVFVFGDVDNGKNTPCFSHHDSFPDIEDLTPKNKTPVLAVSNARGERRASRIPLDWEPSREMVNWALTEQPTWDRAHALSVGEAFRDYWSAKSGADARKLDWDATWRNWVRREKPMPKARAPDGLTEAGRETQAAVSRWIESEERKDAENAARGP